MNVEVRMKKIISILLVIGTLFMFTGCSKEANLTQTPSEIVAAMYEGFGEEELPMMLGERELVADELEYNLGLTELNFVEGTVSEPMISSIAHSVVVVRVAEGVDIEQTKADIKANVNPSKWLCVTADSVLVESKGDIIVLVMSSNELAPKLMENFKNLK
jgi:hypothetical protein